MENAYILFLLTCGLLAIVGYAFSLNCFSFLDAGSGHGRNNNLDGLRYVLASMVVFHHMDYFNNYFSHKGWYATTGYINYLGRIGVAAFFMITAFLFWGKISKQQSVDWLSLYKDRFFRIVPLATLVSLLAIILILYKTGFPEVNKVVLKDVMSWFDAGLFDRKPDINGMTGSRIVIAGVTWTLRWEWFFYFSLPALWFFRKHGLEMSIVMFFFSCFILKDYLQYNYLWSYFFGGIIAKEIQGKMSVTNIQSNILFVLLSFIFYLSEPLPNTETFAFYMLGFFIILVNGFDLFGILNTKGFVRLGHISYSIYLNQGIVMYIAFSITGGFRDELSFGIQMSLSFIALCLFSTVTYVLAEKPFIRMGKKLML